MRRVVTEPVVRLDHFWDSRNGVALLLWPLSQLFGLVALLRRMAYRWGLLRAKRFPVPVLVVGNITVGGTGKTPLVIWLAEFLRQRGFRPGIVSRGYGGAARHWPQQVRADSDPGTVGDEAVMLAARTGLPDVRRAGSAGSRRGAAGAIPMSIS